VNPEIDTPTPIYAAAATHYWNQGWRCILPMRPATKWPPVTGYTGYTGDTPSYPDIQAWTEDRPDGNLALRLPRNVIGIDVDDYGTKTGGTTYLHALNQWGPLPATVRSTSRNDISGIRLYRVPEGTHLATVLEFPELGLKHIEIIQWWHRYVTAYPSIHPGDEHTEPGAQYRWLDEQGFVTDIPNPNDLPELPTRWLEALSKPYTDLNIDAPVDVQAALAHLPDGPMDATVADRLNTAIKDLAGGSRHDATLGHVMAFLRYGEQHHSGVQLALTALGGAFVATVTQDGSRTPDDARAEYNRMVAGPRAHALIAATPSTTLQELDDELRILGGIATRNREPAPDEDPEPDPDNDEVPADAIWQSRDTLEQIQQWAYARMCSPWAVLGVCLARALTTVPPWITLPPIIGGRGSLNYFVALVGPSGTGKGAAEAVAPEIITPDIHVSPAGSGEGLAHQYVHIEKRELIRDRNAVLFSIPEIDTLMSVGNRTGSTILSKLRSAFSGEEIGFSYADPTKRLLVGAHNYRLCLVMGVQPEKAAPLLGDSGGGTPQRFLWLPSTDPNITIGRPDTPPPLHIPETRDWVGRPRNLTIPPIVEETLLTEHVKRARGEGDALDGHALFVREKTAMALAIVDGRQDMNEQDWELSGLVMAKSTETRAYIDRTLRDVSALTNAETGRAQGQIRVSLDDTVTESRIRTVGQRIVANLEKFGGEDTLAMAKQHIWSKHRDWFEDALKTQVLAGNIIVQDGILRLPGGAS
jgi:hypothetical protein